MPAAGPDHRPDGRAGPAALPAGLLPDARGSGGEPPTELHIASLVVHTLPHRLAEVESAAASLAGVEVHGSDAAGKLVVTIEALGGDRLLETIDRLRAIAGVVAASLVYQCADTLDAMNEDCTR